MSQAITVLLDKYIELLKAIYGNHLKEVILYGSRARGDNRPDSDFDIMILIDMPDLEIKDYQKKLSMATYDYNMDNDVEIMPTAKSRQHYLAWKNAYPFYQNIAKEGIKLYGAA